MRLDPIWLYTHWALLALWHLALCCSTTPIQPLLTLHTQSLPSLTPYIPLFPLYPPSSLLPIPCLQLTTHLSPLGGEGQVLKVTAAAAAAAA